LEITVCGLKSGRGTAGVISPFEKGRSGGIFGKRLENYDTVNKKLMEAETRPKRRIGFAGEKAVADEISLTQALLQESKRLGLQKEGVTLAEK
jgi:hypothetical protein